jgi:hypothetical protein
VFAKKIDFSVTSTTPGIYVCSHCGTPLFEATKQFEAGCGFPSFWMHMGEQVKLNPLHTMAANEYNYSATAVANTWAIYLNTNKHLLNCGIASTLMPFNIGKRRSFTPSVFTGTLF